MRILKKWLAIRISHKKYFLVGEVIGELWNQSWTQNFVRIFHKKMNPRVSTIYADFANIQNK